jgi:DNA-binding NarL/FixJ family response regulator
MKRETLIRILIADDHNVVRVGLKQLFSQMGGVIVAAEAENGMQVLEILQQRSDFDLLLLDITLPDINGIDVIARIRNQNISLPILVFSMHNEPFIAKRAFQIGASGFITKGCSLEILMEAIFKCASGGRFIDPGLSEQIIFGKTVSGEEIPHDKLSEREFHILKLFAAGKTGNEIADILAISKKTVSTHKSHLMQKMNFQNIAELVLYALDYALIE